MRFKCPGVSQIPEVTQCPTHLLQELDHHSIESSLPHHRASGEAFKPTGLAVGILRSDRLFEVVVDFAGQRVFGVAVVQCCNRFESGLLLSLPKKQTRGLGKNSCPEHEHDAPYDLKSDGNAPRSRVGHGMGGQVDNVREEQARDDLDLVEY